MPIGSLKADFTNIPPGTKLTVGSILFNMLDLPEGVAVTDAAAPGSGEQLQTKSAAKRAPASNGVAPASGSAAKVGEAGEGEGDSFSRIEIRVGRITKVRG